MERSSPCKVPRNAGAVRPRHPQRPSLRRPRTPSFWLMIFWLTTLPERSKTETRNASAVSQEGAGLRRKYPHAGVPPASIVEKHRESAIGWPPGMIPRNRQPKQITEPGQSPFDHRHPGTNAPHYEVRLGGGRM